LHAPVRLAGVLNILRTRNIAVESRPCLLKKNQTVISDAPFGLPYGCNTGAVKKKN
jgi:hypothetical protein